LSKNGQRFRYFGKDWPWRDRTVNFGKKPELWELAREKGRTRTPRELRQAMEEEKVQGAVWWSTLEHAGGARQGN